MSPKPAPQPPEVRDARFIAEARDVRGLPPAGAIEIAIAGRSNVGKSTLLNRLAARKGLARTSRTPGRTRGIVLFELALGKGAPEAVKALRLADLPGYGYAKVSRDERDSWQPLIEGYTRARATLALFVILVDARRGIEDEERQLYEWLGTENVPAQIVFTKVDKLSASERGLLRDQTRRQFRGRGPLLVSAESGEGVPELWTAIFSAATAIAAPPLAGAPDGA
ncbi:MAG TPA: ribosome biogenesis GTP-binding protein YihA/YsxC [Polyangia bacterium]|nr:ribosome biogenesis GTP-binding protein YihA/YsxC [Polyangia bacterium]